MSQNWYCRTTQIWPYYRFARDCVEDMSKLAAFAMYCSHNLHQLIDSGATKGKKTELSVINQTTIHMELSKMESRLNETLQLVSIVYNAETGEYMVVRK